MAEPKPPSPPRPLLPTLSRQSDRSSSMGGLNSDIEGSKDVGVRGGCLPPSSPPDMVQRRRAFSAAGVLAGLKTPSCAGTAAKKQDQPSVLPSTHISEASEAPAAPATVPAASSTGTAADADIAGTPKRRLAGPAVGYSLGGQAAVRTAPLVEPNVHPPASPFPASLASHAPLPHAFMETPRPTLQTSLRNIGSKVTKPDEHPGNDVPMNIKGNARPHAHPSAFPAMDGEANYRICAL